MGPRVLLLLLVFGLSSASLLVVNKMAVKAWPQPSLLLLTQVASTVVFIAGPALLRLVDAKLIASVPVMKAYGLVAVVFLGSIYCNIRMLALVSVNTFIVLRCSTPLIMAVLDWRFMGRQFPGVKSVASLVGCLVFAGFYAAQNSKGSFVSTDETAPRAALFWAVSWLLFFLTDNLYVKHVVDKFPVNGLERALYQNGWAAAILLVLVVGGVDGQVVSRASLASIPIFQSGRVALVVALSCGLGTALSYAGMSLRSELSSTSFTVLGVACKMASILLNEALALDPDGGIVRMFWVVMVVVCSAQYKPAPLRSADQKSDSDEWARAWEWIRKRAILSVALSTALIFSFVIVLYYAQEHGHATVETSMRIAVANTADSIEVPTVPTRRALILTPCLAGLSDRLFFFVMSMYITMALDMDMIFPTPCVSINASTWNLGMPLDCSFSWTRYINITYFESIIRSQLVPDGKFRYLDYDTQRAHPRYHHMIPVHDNDPLQTIQKILKETSAETSIQMSGCFSIGNKVAALKKALLALNNAKYPKQLDAFYQVDDSASLGGELRTIFEAASRHYHFDEPFLAVKIRRGDRIRQGIGRCTDLSYVMQTIRIHAFRSTLFRAFIMTDETDPRYLNDLRTGLQNAGIDVIFEDDVEQLRLLIDRDHDNQARYRTALAIFGQASKEIFAFHRSGASDDSVSLCRSTIVTLPSTRDSQARRDLSFDKMWRCATHLDMVPLKHQGLGIGNAEKRVFALFTPKAASSTLRSLVGGQRTSYDKFSSNSGTDFKTIIVHRDPIDRLISATFTLWSRNRCFDSCDVTDVFERVRLVLRWTLQNPAWNEHVIPQIHYSKFATNEKSRVLVPVEELIPALADLLDIDSPEQVKKNAHEGSASGAPANINQRIREDPSLMMSICFLYEHDWLLFERDSPCDVARAPLGGPWCAMQVKV